MGAHQKLDPAAADPFASFNATAELQSWPCRTGKALNFAHKELSEVARLWREKAGDRAIPARADIDARSLKSVLANVTILERVAETGTRYRVRLHGTSQTKYSGDHTGAFLDDMLEGTADAYNAVYDLILNERKPARILWDYQLPVIAYLKGESFVAPLLDANGNVTLLLSVTFTESKTAIR